MPPKTKRAKTSPEPQYQFRRPRLSDQLRRIVNERGVTPYAISQAAGIEPSSLHRFLKNGQGLRSETIDRLCDALDLELKQNRRGRPAASSRHEND